MQPAERDGDAGMMRGGSFCQRLLKRTVAVGTLLSSTAGP